MAKEAALLNYGITETNPFVLGTHPGSVRAHNSQFYDIVVAVIFHFIGQAQNSGYFYYWFLFCLIQSLML